MVCATNEFGAAGGHHQSALSAPAPTQLSAAGMSPLRAPTGRTDPAAGGTSGDQWWDPAAGGTSGGPAETSGGTRRPAGTGSGGTRRPAGPGSGGTTAARGRAPE